MFSNVASNLSSSATLASFGCSSFDCPCLASTVQSSLGCFPFQGLGMGFLDLRRRLVRLVRHVREEILLEVVVRGPRKVERWCEDGMSKIRGPPSRAGHGMAEYM